MARLGVSSAVTSDGSIVLEKNIRPKLDDWTIFPNYKGVKGLASLRSGPFEYHHWCPPSWSSGLLYAPALLGHVRIISLEPKPLA